jgi:ribosomal-protein-alanine N-acetyltransferase
VIEQYDISLAKPADAGTIAEMSRDYVEYGLEWQWKPARIAKKIRANDTNVAVARLGKVIVACAIMRYADIEAHLELLAVQPNYRKRGIGRHLVEWLTETADVAGIQVIYVETRIGNAGARSFYARLGYKDIEIVPRYYCGRESAVRLAYDMHRNH